MLFQLQHLTERLRAFFLRGPAVAKKIFRIGGLRVRMALVVLFVVVAELDQQEAALFHPFPDGSEQALVEKGFAGPAGKGVVVDGDAFGGGLGDA